jgi:plastocyanin
VQKHDKRLNAASSFRALLGVAAAVAASALGSPALAADLKVLVVAHGKPVADAVVMVRRPAGESGPVRFPWPMVVEQRNMQFRPFVLIAPVGAEVAFPNHDPFQHHVYSFSPAKTFELKLYGHDETRRVRFDKTGVVALGCNIHDDMTGFVRVVDTPYAAKTDAAGEAVIRGLAAGPAELSVWHPYLRGGRDLTREVGVTAAGATVSVPVELKSPPMMHGGY